MSESKSPFGNYHEMVHIWQGYKHRTVQPAAGTMQKINSVG